MLNVVCARVKCLMSQSTIIMNAIQVLVWTYRLSCRSDLQAKGSTSVWCEPVDRVKSIVSRGASQVCMSASQLLVCARVKYVPLL